MDIQNSAQNDQPIGQVQHPQPGSLNFVPSSSVAGETAVESIVPTVVEKAPIPAETQKNQENEPIYNTPEENKKRQQDTQNAAPQSSPPTPRLTKIVDRSKEPLRLHHIQNPQDKLTAEADTKEEKFIEEVETAHGHK